MRLDKWLKTSRLIKRRTLAKEACDGGRVQINGRVAKPGSEVEAGDRLTVHFGNRTLEVEVLSTPDNIKAAQAGDCFRVLTDSAAG